MGKTPNYTKAVVIVHGKSELILVQYIRSNLKLPIKIVSKENGRKSIEITSLKNEFRKPEYKSVEQFADKHNIEFDESDGCLNSFKLFVIMDKDDCSEEIYQSYINKSLFRNSPLKDYIVPICNNPDLETVLTGTKYMPKPIRSKDKASYYSKIFPVNHSGHYDHDILKDLHDFYNCLNGIQNTNMDQFIKYCLDLI